MLTVDHVKLRRRKGLVEVVPLCGVPRERALDVANVAVEVARVHEGEPRSALEEALDELPVDDKDVRFGRGVKKLILDAVDFDVDSTVPPEELRHEVFLEAARERAEGGFDRARVLETVAQQRGLGVNDVEQALFADLSAAHAVKGFDVTSGEELLVRYARAELQAVLLRATRLTVDVAGTTHQVRALLRALKLHQLLFELDAAPLLEDGVRLVVEGPMSLFQQSTRYGLKLAMLLPWIVACRRAHLEATVRLRPHGATETFVLDHQLEGPGDETPFDAPEVVRELVADLDRAGGPWRPRFSAEILRLPGAGALVPDVELTHAETGEVVYVEVLGFWSRAAVWRRVELVEQGLPFRVVFCASERLRVSEEALPAESGGALVVFKGALRASRVLEAVGRMTGR